MRHHFSIVAAICVFVVAAALVYGQARRNHRERLNQILDQVEKDPARYHKLHLKDQVGVNHLRLEIAEKRIHSLEQELGQRGQKLESQLATFKTLAAAGGQLIQVGPDRETLMEIERERQRHMSHIESNRAKERNIDRANQRSRDMDNRRPLFDDRRTQKVRIVR